MEANIVAPPEHFLEAHTDKRQPDCVRVWIFGKDILLGPFTGERAVAIATEWNEFLAAEWMKVRETNAAILQAFTEKLKEEGVSETAVRNAMAAVQTDIQDGQ